MRQESSFDPTAISGSDAIGLMQLLPSTARHTARTDGIPFDGNLENPSENMALGTAYIAGLIQQFGNCVPLAVAAYNAGPSNVANWLAENGDPELGGNAGGANLIDWVERDTVQRDAELRTACDGEYCDLSGAADRHGGQPAKTVVAVVRCLL